MYLTASSGRNFKCDSSRSVSVEGEIKLKYPKTQFDETIVSIANKQILIANQRDINIIKIQRY